MTRWDELPEHLLKRIHGCIGRELPKSKAAKYHNNPCEVDGIRFDSQLEAKYYSNLLLLKRAGVVTDIKLQQSFELQPAFKNAAGQRIRAIKYAADFVVRYADGRQQVVDTKGMQTQVYKLKKKMLLYRYPDIDFVEVSDV